MTPEAAAKMLERILRDPNDHWSEIGKESLEMGAAALRKVPVLERRIAELEKRWEDLKDWAASESDPVDWKVEVEMNRLEGL